MSITEVFCPICQINIPKQIIKQWPGYRLLQCNACGVKYADPFKAASADWYAKFGIYESGFDKKYPLDWRHRKFLSLNLMLPTPSKLLDVGCGTGNFLKAAQDHGYIVHGLDFETRRVEFGTQYYNVSIEVTTLKDHLMAGAKGRYDIVTFFEFLEHLDNPIEFITEVKRVLRPGGMIGLSVPNAERTFDLSDYIGDYPPHHLTWWSKKALRYFLERNGFTDIQIYEEPFDLRRVLFLRIKTGIEQAVMRVVSGAPSRDGRQRQVLVAKLTRETKNIILSAAIPVGLIAGALFKLKGIGLLAVARQVN